MSANSTTLLVARSKSGGPAAPSGLRVTVTTGPDQGLTHVVTGSRAIIGRGDSADVRLQDQTVSQFHVELSLCADGVSVTDLDSTNGVHASGMRILRGVVPAGAALSLGATTIIVEPVRTARLEVSAETAFGGLVGQSAVMRELYTLLARLARNDLSVIIQGATGTGKEEAARVLQAKSSRASGPFVVLDCTAIPATLAPSLLFGHTKGAFTGATDSRSGVFESASDGVLFIDEVGELPLELQPLLLRVLQNREVVPVGSTRPRKVNVRVISATWRDLRAMVNRGTFREDLYYRLAQASVWMPSLDERSEDIPLLVQHFLARLPGDVQAARAMSENTLELLCSRSFPGNVRELRNTVERLALLAEGPTVTSADMAFERILAAARARAPQAVSPPSTVSAEREDTLYEESFKEAKRTVIDEFERAYLQRLLERTQRNLTRAAQMAGLERHNLRDLLRKHGLYSASG